VLREPPEIETTVHLDLFMFLRSFKLFAAALITAVLSVACGGDAAPAPTGLTVTATGESSATMSWNMASGVEYWLFYGPTSVAPTDTTSMHNWIGLPGGNVLLKVTSPYVVSGLVNGTPYSFSINGRTDGGPGGPGTTPVLATPRIAGSSWTAGTAPSSIDLRSVAFGATTATTTASVATYVAAGAGGAMYSSSDGATWSAINFVTASNLNGASYFGNYTLVGDGGVVITSPDAVTWTTQTSGTTQNLYAIASNNLSLNVAVGANGSIITSPDGVTWTLRASPTSQSLYAVTYSPYNQGTNTLGTWVAVGNNGTMVQSVDGGVTWGTVNVGAGVTANLRGIAYGTSTSAASVVTQAFVAVGASGTVLGSPDGLNWTVQAALGGNNLNTVTAALTIGPPTGTVVTQYVAAGAGGAIFTSTDGLNWNTTNSTTLTSNALYAVTRDTTAGELGYVAVGQAGTNLLSK